MPKQSRSEETRAVIIQAAAQVLLERDYASSSTNRIAERAGVSVGSIYQYFNNKEEIFEEVLNDFFANLVIQLEDAAISHDTPVEELAEIISFKALTFRKDGPALLRKLRQVSNAYFDNKLALTKIIIADFIKRILEDRDDINRVGDFDISLKIFVDAVDGIYINSAPDIPATVLAKEISILFIRYLQLEPL